VCACVCVCVCDVCVCVHLDQGEGGHSPRTCGLLVCINKSLSDGRGGGGVNSGFSTADVTCAEQLAQVQCVAVCCSVLQCDTAVCCCSVLQCVALVVVPCRLYVVEMRCKDAL